MIFTKPQFLKTKGINRKKFPLYYPKKKLFKKRKKKKKDNNNKFLIRFTK